jgi:hypothetical protein
MLILLFILIISWIFFWNLFFFPESLLYFLFNFERPLRNFAEILRNNIKISRNTKVIFFTFVPIHPTS